MAAESNAFHSINEGMNKFYFIYIFVALIIAGGCKTVPPKPQHQTQQIDQDLKSVAGALSNKPLTEDEWQDLKHQLKTDKEARSAVEVITDSLQDKKVIIKYCPLDGKRFSSSLKICPEHGVELKNLEE